MKKHIFFILVLLSIITNKTFAADKEGQIGLIFLSDLSSEPLQYGLLFWPASKWSIELTGGFEKIDINDNSGTSYIIGID